MNDKEYAIYLSDKLSDMLRKNYEGENIYRHLNLPKFATDEYWVAYNKLTEREKLIVRNYGKIYTKAEITRTRIELNKILIKLEKF